MPQAHDIAIGLLCKAPLPGVSKTRLLPVLGPQRTAALAAAFIQDVGAAMVEAAHLAGAAPVVFQAPADAEALLRALLPGVPRFMRQAEGGLTPVMVTALDSLLADHAGAILMGCDVPGVPPDLIALAVTSLRQPATDMVIAPARDGGYFLIGMKATHRRLFEGMVWSTATVLTETLVRAAALGLAVEVLEAWPDVDDGPDLERLALSLAREEAADHAPATRALLASWSMLPGPISPAASHATGDR
jgi:rSAM/selenodomain-associated transferase 1